jgi:superfamily I DNA/RNA helicase
MADYTSARRAGRGRPLNAVRKVRFWKTQETFLQLLAEEKLTLYPLLARELADWLIQQPSRRYAAIIGDEIQDFHPEQLRLLRALVAEGPNDLFLVGDPCQKLYGKPTVFSRCGINVRGNNSKRLVVNYRTTHEIRTSAVRVLAGLSFEDFIEGQQETLKEHNYVSLVNGENPLVQGFPTFQKEVAAVAKFIKDESGIPRSEMCVAARTHQLVEDWTRELKQQGIRALPLTESVSDAGDCIRIGTMHRLKGLEFSTVFLVSQNRAVVPPPIRSDDAEVSEELLRQERSLLYVAMTRPRRGLWVSCFGEPSSLLESVFRDFGS